MALDLAESLISCRTLDQDDIALRFAKGYRWSRGYGPGAARLLKLVRRGVPWRTAATRVFDDGSFGNGGAMRAPVIGLFCAPDVDRVVAQARATAVITHAHPLGQEGAVLVALATALALDAHAPGDILEALRGHAQHALLRERIVIAHGWLGSGRTTAYDVREQLGNGITASESCVTALHIALAFLERPFGEMLAFVADCRGDVDTIGAMAGAIWGARNGESALPAQMIAQLEDPDRVRRVALALHETTNSAAPT